MEVWHANDWKRVKEAEKIGKAEETVKSILAAAKQTHSITTLNNYFKRNLSDTPKVKGPALLALWMIQHGIPFASFDSDILQKWANLYNLDASVFPKRRQLTSIHIPILKKVIWHLVQQKLQCGADFVAITCDGWENIRKHREIGITAHFIDPNFKEVSHVLVTVEELSGEHNATMLSNFIDKKLTEFLPSNSTVIACVTDGAANFRLAANLLMNLEDNNDDTWHCVAHRLQLCLSDVLDEKDSTATLDLNCVHTIVTTIHRSANLREEYSRIQRLEGLDRLQLILPVPTRFDSQLAMLQRFLENITVIQIMVRNGSLDKILSLEQRKDICTLEYQVRLQSYEEILNLIHKVTEAISTDKNITLSSIPKIVHALLNDLKPDAVHDNMIKTQLKKAIRKRVKDRFGKILTETNIALRAAALDPRYGHLDFVSKEVRDNTWTKIIEEAINLPLNTSMQVGNDDELSFIPDDNILKTTIEKQLNCIRKHFETKKNELTNENPLTFWKTMINERGFKELSDIVRTYLCIPAIQISSERAFSSSGFIHNTARASLNTEHTTELQFIRGNIGNFEVDEILTLYDNYAKEIE
jgi:hypothetical protein